jgi:hypothetical protein
MKTAGRGNPNRRTLCSATEIMARKIRTTPAQSTGLRSKEIFQPLGMYFFLTSSFIELTGKLRTGPYLSGFAVRQDRVNPSGKL